MGSTARAQGAPQAVPPEIRIDRINATLIPSPEFGSRDEVRPPRDAFRWLQIEVEFTMRIDRSLPQFVDELTFKYYVGISDDLLAGGSANPLSGRALLGEIIHTDVKASTPGSTRMSVAYVAPRAFERMVGGRTINTSNVNIAVEVVMAGVPTPLAVESVGPLARQAAGWWTQVPHVTGLLLPRDRTPFGPLSYDRYEPVKQSLGR